ncbi:MAG TPA: division/cell wall cluster transcriptional repressor MraZ, partial [Allosphingosinicella sp.]
MHVEHLFGGSALAAVDSRGRVRLPRFVREVTERRSDAGLVVLGPHESDACVTGYDPSWRRMLFADAERRRLQDETAGGPATHHARARRAFGLTEQAEIDSRGSIALPPMIRRIARIEGLALFVGTGGAFEIWNPHVA